MKRKMILLALSGLTFLAAAPAGCSSQLTGVLSLLCPDCYQHYLDLQGNN